MLVMFIPLGFLLPIAFQKMRNLWKTALTLALLSFAIEFNQQKVRMEERIWTTQKLTRLDRFEGLRKENGLTLEQLAERTGLSSSGASNNIMSRQ